MQSFRPIRSRTLAEHRRRRYAGNVSYSKELRSLWRYLGGGGAEVALAQPHHPLAQAWFSVPGRGFNPMQPGKWGYYYNPGIPVDINAGWTSNIPKLFYVDKSAPDNVYQYAEEHDNVITGYPERPRRRLPTHAEPGSIIVVTNRDPNNPYDASDVISGAVRVGGFGTMTQPIFVIGNAFGPKTKIVRPFQVEGYFVVAQGFEIALPTEVTGDVPLTIASRHGGGSNYDRCDHIVIRDFEISAPRIPAPGVEAPMPLPDGSCAVPAPRPEDVCFQPGNRSGIAIYGVLHENDPNYPVHVVHNIIIANTKIRDIGAWEFDPCVCDHDEHGIGIGRYANTVTIMNCEMYHCEGDGIQINAVEGVNESTAEQTHTILVYRNKSHDNKQSGMWVKYSKDIKFLENEVYNIRGSRSSADGPGMGGQYGPVNPLFIGNTIHDCKTGILVTSLNTDGTPLPSPLTGGAATGLCIAENTISNAQPSTGDEFTVGFGIVLRSQPVSGICPIIRDNKLFSCFGGIATVGSARTITAPGNTFCDVGELGPLPPREHILFEDCAAVGPSYFGPSGSQTNAVVCPEENPPPLRVTPACGGAPNCPPPWIW